jgi:hypothetical protein
MPFDMNEDISACATLDTEYLTFSGAFYFLLPKSLLPKGCESTREFLKN